MFDIYFWSLSINMIFKVYFWISCLRTAFEWYFLVIFQIHYENGFWNLSLKSIWKQFLIFLVEIVWFNVIFENYFEFIQNLFSNFIFENHIWQWNWKVIFYFYFWNLCLKFLVDICLWNLCWTIVFRTYFQINLFSSIYFWYVFEKGIMI